MKLKFAALTAVLMMAANSAHANIITTDVNILNADPGAVQYVHFKVTTPGLFDIWALGQDTLGAGYNRDPKLFLFHDTPSFSNYIDENDDYGSNVYDALIRDLLLSVGNYVVAVSQAEYFTEDAAVSGINAASVDDPGLIQVSIDGHNGTAVPEPATLALMTLGLLGLTAARRKAA